MDIKEVINYIDRKMDYADSPYFENETFCAMRKAKSLKLDKATKTEILELEKRLKIISSSNSDDFSLNRECFHLMRDLYQLLFCYQETH